MGLPGDVDIDETRLLQRYPEVLNALLVDHTTGGYLIWGTTEYESIGVEYGASQPITPSLITGLAGGVIRPRALKDPQIRSHRTKRQAEVFTPTWVCNQQNNLVDAAWFGGSSPFNTESGHSWTVTDQPISFPTGKSWTEYVDENRLEMACGEGPYLASRYDPSTGLLFPLDERVGMLDRKLRVVCENTRSEVDWFCWAERAFQSIYGFEIQGDSLLLARENLLATFADHVEDRFARQPKLVELLHFAEIISWNLWQMDAFTLRPPGGVGTSDQMILDLEPVFSNPAPNCVVRDWRSDRVIPFVQLKDR